MIRPLLKFVFSVGMNICLYKPKNAYAWNVRVLPEFPLRFLRCSSLPFPFNFIPIYQEKDCPWERPQYVYVLGSVKSVVPRTEEPKRSSKSNFIWTQKLRRQIMEWSFVTTECSSVSPSHFVALWNKWVRCWCILTFIEIGNKNEVTEKQISHFLSIFPRLCCLARSRTSRTPASYCPPHYGPG